MKLIDGDNLISRFEKASEIVGSDLFPVPYIKQCVIEMPAIEPESLVKHGKWYWDLNGMDWGLGAWKCSECACRNNNLPMNSRINPLRFSGSNYCPNCGAKMDGGNESEL